MQYTSLTNSKEQTSLQNHETLVNQLANQKGDTAQFQHVGKFHKDYSDIKIDRCPGTFGQGCGAPLRWFKARRVWGCQEYPRCKYIYVPPIIYNFPYLSLEIHDHAFFKVVAAPGAEAAVLQSGGVSAILHNIKQFKSSQDSQNISKVQQKSEVFIPVIKYLEIEQSLLKRGYLLKGACIPPRVFQCMSTGLPKADQHEVRARLKKMPKFFVDLLLEFQFEGVQFVLKRFGRGLIADEMGVGKTVQAIALAMCYYENWPLLIIVPASMRLIWAAQLEWWIPNTFLNPKEIHVIQSSQDRINFKNIPKIVITSYQMLMRLSCQNCCDGKFHRCQNYNNNINTDTWCMAGGVGSGSGGWGMIIADESHTLRTTKMIKDGICTEAAYSAIRRTKRAVMLTGTPSLSRPFDLFRQVDSLQPGLLGNNKYQFAERYCDKKIKMIRGWRLKDYSGGSRLHELHQVLRKEVMIRRLKSEVAKDLPPKTRTLIMLPRPKNFEVDRNISAQHATGLAKVDTIIHWLINRLKNNPQNLQYPEKTLLFCHHKSVMRMYAEALEGFANDPEWQGVKFVFIDGETDSKERFEAVQKFHDDKEVRVALVSLTAGGVGLDFSVANTVIFAELPNQISWLVQAESRAHRRKAKNHISIFFMCAQGTSDEPTWQLINRQLKNLEVVHDGIENYGLTIDHTIHLSKHQIHPSSFDSTEPSINLNPQNLQKHNTDFHLKQNTSNINNNTNSKNFRFQVSKNTERIHLYFCKNLSIEKFSNQNNKFQQNLVPLGISFPINHLLSADKQQELLQEIQVWFGLEGQQSGYHLGKYGIMMKKDCFNFKQNELYFQLIEFAKKWKKMRAVHKNKLYGEILALDFEEQINNSQVKNRSETSRKIRRLTLKYIEDQVPKGLQFLKIKIKSRGKSGKFYHHDFGCLVDGDNNCICLSCKNNKTQLGQVFEKQEVLGFSCLYCSRECQREYLTKTSNSFMRQEIFKLERGICTLCSLNCHNLAQKLRFVDSMKNIQSGKQIIKRYAPKLLEVKYAGVLNNMIKNPWDGNVWHVDHIIPVYKGGGMCDLENLRTLCVACHQEQTSKQVQERALLKKKSAL